MIEKNKITLVIADDHPMILKGLYEELKANNYSVLAQASNGNKALEAILFHKPKLALLDIDMPGLSGFEVIKKAREKDVYTRYIVLSFHKEAEYVAQAKALDIKGYLLKEDAFHDVEKCIQTVLNDEECFSHSFEKGALKNVSGELQRLKDLTPSETVILKLVAQQVNTNEIAETLFVSTRTIEKHRSNIISKLLIEGSTNALTNWALTNKSLILDL